MDTLQDPKTKHKNGRNANYPVSTAVEQRSTNFPDPELFLALLRNFKRYHSVKLTDQPSNIFAA